MPNKKVTKKEQQKTDLLQISGNGFTKFDLEQMASNAISKVMEQGNPLPVAEAISAFSYLVDKFKEMPDFKEYVREEITKHGKAYTSPSGAKLELFESVGKHSFDWFVCNDPKVIELIIDVDLAAEKLKQRQDFLKALPATGVEIVDANTGEVNIIYPPNKTSVSTYKVTLAKQ